MKGMLKVTQFVRQKSTSLQNKRFLVQKTCTEICEQVEVCTTVSFPTILLELQIVENLQKAEKCKLRGSLMYKEMEN